MLRACRYNAVESSEFCPPAMLDCADCTERNLEEYERLLQMIDGSSCHCDPATQAQVIDPCYWPKSCGCYCETLIRVQACDKAIDSGVPLGPLNEPSARITASRAWLVGP